MNTQQKMQQMILEAYANPTQKNCFYSANSIPTEIERLDDLPFWDWTPQVSHQVEGNSTCIFPLALGCKRIELEVDEWAEDMFDEETLLSASEFPIHIPDVWEGKSGQLLKNIEKQLNEIPVDDLIRQPDIQSPFGIAEVICGSSLYMAIMLNPEPVHKLLNKITDFVIKFIKEVRKVAGIQLNGTQFPYIWNNHQGTLCSDDSLTLLSPEMHEQFSLPYVNRIADECGHLFYHSCTWKEEYFNNIKKVRNVRAYNWNPGNSTDPGKIVEAFSGNAVLAPHFGPDMHITEDTKNWGHFADEAEMFEYMLDCMLENTSYYFWLGCMEQRPKQLERMYNMLHERGYTPEAKGLF